MKIITSHGEWDLDEYPGIFYSIFDISENSFIRIHHSFREETDVSHWKRKDWDNAAAIFEHVSKNGCPHGYYEDDFVYLFLKHVGPYPIIDTLNFHMFENRGVFARCAYEWWFGIDEIVPYIKFEDIAHDGIADVLSTGGVVFEWENAFHIWTTPEAKLTERKIGDRK